MKVSLQNLWDDALSECVLGQRGDVRACIKHYVAANIGKVERSDLPSSQWVYEKLSEQMVCDTEALKTIERGLKVWLKNYRFRLAGFSAEGIVAPWLPIHVQIDADTAEELSFALPDQGVEIDWVEEELIWGKQIEKVPALVMYPGEFQVVLIALGEKRYRQLAKDIMRDRPQPIKKLA